jgi:hypothetical protein
MRLWHSIIHYPCIRRRRGSAFDGPARRARAPPPYVRGRRRLARSKWCQPDAEQRCAPRAAGLSMTTRILSRTDRGDSNYGVQTSKAHGRESENQRKRDKGTASYTWPQLVPIRHLYLTSTSDYLASWKAKITKKKSHLGLGDRKPALYARISEKYRPRVTT